MDTQTRTIDDTEQFFELKISLPKTRQTITCRLVSTCIVGSDEGSDFIINDPGISAQHARIFVSDLFDVFIEPIGEAVVALNGTVVENPACIQNGDWIVLGTTPYQISIDASRIIKNQEFDKRNTGFDLKGKSLVTIGRSPQCDIEIPSPLVSRVHAKLIKEPSGWVLEDCSSTNGTFINAQRIEGKQKLEPHDYVAIAAFEYLFTGDRFEASKDTGQVRIEVQKLSKIVKDINTKGDKYLLQDISFTIEPGEFIGVFGTSGSGKSTLLDALNGRRPATSGRILYNSTDLYEAFDLFRAAIGYVPQQDIVHRNIVMQHALKYTAKLRLPPDTSDSEMDSNATQVLGKVGLAEKADLLVNTPAPLSGGQLKRVSLAVELVANPNVLFLDEVTSGLDAGTDKKMMELFRSLADDQKTVICITHTLENIETCHLVVLLHQGRLVFYGPPQAVCGYFGIQRLSDIYETLESKPASFWAEKYQASSFYQLYVENRKTPDTREYAGKQSTRQASAPGQKTAGLRQTSTLMKRYFELLMSDKRNMLFLILQAPIIALVVGLVFQLDEKLAVRAMTESQIVFILSLSVIWFGCINSVRELVKELPIYLRERSVNLGIAPYIMSKIIPLTVICFVQCLLLLGVLEIFISIPGDLVSRFMVLFATGVAATTMGLSVSAFVSSNDKAMTMIPMLLVPQIILAGAVVKLEGAALWIAKTTMISYWGFEAMKSTLSDEVKTVKNDFTGELILPINNTMPEGLAAIAGLAVVFLIITLIGLKLKDKAS
ncbi:MAG TPA: ATP-binding cassette domain-containing protein [Nitrosomonas mobilis]|nr:ATP-binding cassette domain-containing protein [Nitrosomonas mobilis]